VVVNATACLNWLAASPPNVVEVRETVQRIVRDGQRAGDVIARIRALATKETIEKERLDLTETVQEAIALVQGLMRRNKVTLDLGENLPPVLGDRIQLQQVVLNLVVNAVEQQLNTLSPALLHSEQEREEVQQQRENLYLAIKRHRAKGH
jgi:signal transduction histidine kinase